MGLAGSYLDKSISDRNADLLGPLIALVAIMVASLDLESSEVKNSVALKRN